MESSCIVKSHLLSQNPSVGGYDCEKSLVGQFAQSFKNKAIFIPQNIEIK